MTDVAITEFEEIDPDELHLVGKGANGFKALLAKSASEEVREVLETIADATNTEIVKADDDRPDCATCKGSGKIMGGNRQCPDCKGSGVKPMPGDTEKSLAQLAAIKEAGVAASGADVPVDPQCGACMGTGKDESGVCDACAGTGKDASAPSPSELNTVNGDAGSITVGAGGRESIDKAAQSAAEQNDLPDSDFAYIEKGGTKDADGKTTPRSLRHFPINDAAHVRNALARASQSPFGDKAMPAIKAAAEKFGVEVSDASKAAGDVFSAANPALASTDAPAATDGAASANTSGDASAAMPGSPGWEAVDADTATQAAMALMAAAELMRTFIQRETQEVAAGEGSDAVDAYMVSSAICGVNDALGVMAQMAFHEGLEAAKSLPDDEVIEKAGRRLAGNTVAALAAARDKANDLAQHIGGVLGDDDPAKKDDASKSADDNNQKDILDMTEDDLQTLVATTVAQAVVAAKSAKSEAKEAKKSSKQDVDNTDSIAGGKAANGKAKAKADDVTDEDKDLEDEAMQGTNDSASSPAKGAAKAELTPEEIEARDARKAAKKALKDAKRVEKQTAENAATAKAIEEAVAKATTAVDSLKEQLASAEKATEDRLAAAEKATQDRLATVEKMAAPSNIVRTAPADAQNVAKARDEIEIRIATLESEARTTSDPAVRAGNREIIKELRAEMTAPKN